MKKIREWQIIFALCCLVYMGWMIHVGGNEFNRINSQYRRIVDRLDEELLRTEALQELIAECRRDSRTVVDREDERCLSWAPPAVEARAGILEQRLTRAKERGLIKLVLFYAIFVLVFLLAPPILIYLLIIGVIKIFVNIKIVR
jgi:hypothetical protein